MTYPVLQPAIVLVLWSLLVLLWMVVTRVPALGAANVDLNRAGGRGTDLDGILPERIQWTAHNYNHLMEQPTLFYAVCLIVAVVAPADRASFVLAWIYVALRIVHSFWQIRVNVVRIRAAIFGVSSTVLIIFALRAAMLVMSV
jgi:hypothetical protein